MLNIEHVAFSYSAAHPVLRDIKTLTCTTSC